VAHKRLLYKRKLSRLLLLLDFLENRDSFDRNTSFFDIGTGDYFIVQKTFGRKTFFRRIVDEVVELLRLDAAAIRALVFVLGSILLF
jgi:hypothetical protein